MGVFDNLRVAMGGEIQERNYSGKIDLTDFLAFASKFVDEPTLQKIEADTKVWYSKDAISQRIEEYTTKVYADKAHHEKPIEEMRHQLNKFLIDSAKTLGYANFNQLPNWQQNALMTLGAICTGLHPKTGNINMSRGVMIIGAKGIGKTTVFELAKKAGILKCRIISTFEIKRAVEANGSAALSLYIKPKELVIDELGWEDEVRYMGNRIDAIAEIIHARYANRLRTHFISNKPVNQLPYQDFVIDRIGAMCNLIDVSAMELKSFR